MDRTRLVVRAAILAAIAGGIAVFFAVSLRPRPPDAPPVPGIESAR